MSISDTYQDGVITAAKPVDALMQLAGDRVRKARQEKGISRQILADKSGVSLRYLAQLESGKGNISIGLLHRVSRALDCRIEWLVGEEDFSTPDVSEVAGLYRNADEQTQQAVLELLKPAKSKAGRAKRVCLIGLRGAGKSTLGKLAGEKASVPFIELNKEIEALGGMPVAEIMALYGQEGYRKLELDALQKVADSHDRLILAAAGGVVAEPQTFNVLLTRFHTVWLKASPDEHMDRVRAQGDTRPMEGNPAAMQQLKSILADREALYARAEAQLDTSEAEMETSLHDLVEIMQERQFI